jgi:RNA polymerase sigma factor (sigma-70 family)
MAEGLEAQRLSIGDDDAVQEGFLRVIRLRDPSGLSNPGGYWYAASRNALRDRRRRELVERRAIQAWLDVRAPAPDPGRWAEEQIGDLHRAIEKLSGQRRRLVDLELGGIRKLSDLAKALEISDGAARVLRHRTYRRLRALLLAEAQAA